MGEGYSWSPRIQGQALLLTEIKLLSVIWSPLDFSCNKYFEPDHFAMKYKMLITRLKLKRQVEAKRVNARGELLIFRRPWTGVHNGKPGLGCLISWLEGGTELLALLADW